MYTVSLETASQEQRQLIGSKALQLAKLVRENICIPNGFIITAHALERFLEANQLQDNLDPSHTCEHILQAEFPPDIQNEIASAYQQLQSANPTFSHFGIPSTLPVVVRSSASAEDLQEASFAGQYETILNVTCIDHLLESIKHCWSSLFSPRVQHYAAQKHVALHHLAMGVLVQLMVAADVSGVIFSMNPVNGDQNEIVINASYGLGEAIVCGLVTPDTFYVDKTDASVRKDLGAKEMKIIPGEKETRELQTTVEEQNRFCLEDEQIDALAMETQKIEALYQQPVDIEFAVKDGQLYILQVRPITTQEEIS